MDDGEVSLVLQQGNVGKHVALHHQHVGGLARGQHADVRLAQGLSRHAGSGLDGFHGAHAELGIHLQLLRAVAVAVEGSAGVGAADDLHARFVGLFQPRIVGGGKVVDSSPAHSRARRPPGRI